MWQIQHDGIEEMLLGLGVWEDDNSLISRHFPMNNLPLAFTASRYLAESGATARSLRIADILSQRIPAGFPQQLLPKEFRELLYPSPYRQEVSRAVERFHVDPYLLLSIIRQESRFDPMAVSPAAARGLAQFIYPTAVRIAKEIGLSNFAAEDLEDPAISIELEGAYLANLNALFRNSRHRVLAAYNAGEAQSRLWQSYCYSWEPEEYYTKVTFDETRNYLDKVLRNRTHYQEIYGPWRNVR